MFSENGFNFGAPGWLFLLVVPFLSRFLPIARRRAQQQARINKYADPHLLPYLLVQGRLGNSPGREKLPWIILWTLGVLALAGPRWDYTAMELYQPGYDVVILLDVSRSMAATDVKPSRIARARQEIEDLLRLKGGRRVGLIGFASVAHIVAPLTDDDQTIRNLLPSLAPELVRLPGSRISAALERARRLLASQPPGSSRHLLLISDGDFDEPGIEEIIRQIRDSGIYFHALGIGTDAGGTVPLSPQGVGVLRDPDTGKEIISRLDEPRLQTLAKIGAGEYQRAVFQDDDIRALLQAIQGNTATHAVTTGYQRVWHERYYLLVIIMMLVILAGFRSVRSASWHN